MDKKYINKVAPHHDRTSCDDDFPTNARYAADDFGGCYRCTLLAAARPVEQAEKDIDAGSRITLEAGIKSGHLGTVKLAAQLAGVPACDGCGYRKKFCRCAAASAEIAAPIKTRKRNARS